MAPAIGMCFDRTFPAGAVIEVAERLDADGIDQLWVIEDCFYTAGVSLAAAALARTSRLHVGLGILPAVARTAAITAMEIATLAELAPGRVIAGIGHGVQDWMDQMGVRPASPLTALDEVLTAVRALLHGGRLDVDGTYVTLRDVALVAPPTIVPPVLAGVRGPRSLAMAGRVCDGVVLAEGAGPTYVAESRAIIAAPSARVSVFTALCVDRDGDAARRSMTGFLASLLRHPEAAIRAHPHFVELEERFQTGGEAALGGIPVDWWTDIGAIGTLDDAAAHVEALARAGADDVALFPAPDLHEARRQLDDVAALAAIVR